MQNEESVVFSVNDIQKDYKAGDFEPSRPEPRSDVFFEFKVGEASLGLAKKGYLQLSLKCNALDAKGATMFTKYMNLALPVSFKGVSPHPAARDIIRQALSALHPENAIYDEIREDAATGKKVYLKGGTVVAGKDYDAAAKNLANAVVAIIDDLTNPATASTSTQALVGRTFFAKVVPSKDGEYSNIKSMLGHAPTKDPVVYDRALAFGK